MIVVSVGTFAHGFDELVRAADAAAAELRLSGFAQIGNSEVIPATLAWERFLPHAALIERLRAASVIVCHGGAGIIGEAMRAQRPIVAMPRRGATRAAHPANDQLAFLERLAAATPIVLCRVPALMESCLSAALELGGAPIGYPSGSNVPEVIAGFLARTAQSSSHAGDRSG